VDRQFQLLAVPNHQNGIDLADLTAVDGEMQSLLDKWGGGYLLNQVRARYSHHRFFGLSALGCNPHATNRIPRVLPRRVEDPFLWLLYRHGLIGAARPAMGSS
jgi:hypothetical protein